MSKLIYRNTHCSSPLQTVAAAESYAATTRDGSEVNFNRRMFILFLDLV